VTAPAIVAARPTPARDVRRVLVVGLGSIGRRHARIAATSAPGLVVAALRHRDAAAPTGVALDLCTTSLDAALAWRPDAAIIASPAPQHVAVATALAEAGVHLLIEKPIADRADDVAALLATARARGIVLATGYNLRFLPSLRRFRALVGQGIVGRVHTVRAEAGQHLATWRPDTDWRRGVSASAALGGGVLLELSHELDYLRWCFGEVATVDATLTRTAFPELDVEDTAHLVLRFRDGTPAPVASVALDFTRHDPVRRCTAIGTDGTLEWDGIAGTVRLRAPGADGWTICHSAPVPRDHTYALQWAHLVRCVRTGQAPRVSGEDGLAVLRIVDAARTAAHRTPVPVPA
jgi:predicted dehydrogenase